MCGIIGYVGSRDCEPLLLHGLERLEYRGYDSAGIALLEEGGLRYVRAVGNLGFLKEAAAAIDEAMNISPSPIPTTSGVWQRTPTSSSGWSWWMTTNEKWPSSWS